MSEPIFRIPKKKYGGDTTVISVRMPKDLLKDIDQVAALSGRSRTDTLNLSMEFALHHTEILMKED